MDSRLLRTIVVAVQSLIILSTLGILFLFAKLNSKIPERKIAEKPNPILKLHQTTDQESCYYNRTKIGIFIAVTDVSNYRVALNSLQCYLRARNYPYIFMVNLRTDEKVKENCSKSLGFGFMRHCAAALYLDEVDWLFVLDADTAVINFEHCLEDFIHPQADIIHYERFHNGEIAAGNYIAKNSFAAKRYLLSLANFQLDLLEQLPFSNGDNGALHMHLLHNLVPFDIELQGSCKKIWYQAASLNDYDKGSQLISLATEHGRPSKMKIFTHKIPHSLMKIVIPKFTACAKMALGRQQKQTIMGVEDLRVVIFPRGQGWVRDAWITEGTWWSGDFMLHGIKGQSLGPFVDTKFSKEGFSVTEQCKSDDLFEWTTFRNRFLIVTALEMEEVFEKAQKRVAENRSNSFFFHTDVRLCWPHCKKFLANF